MVIPPCGVGVIVRWAERVRTALPALSSAGGRIQAPGSGAQGGAAGPPGEPLAAVCDGMFYCGCIKS